MIIWNVMVVWLCKALYGVMRLRGSHGAALPGLVAEKLNPGLLELLTTLPEGIIVVSGTNGKTTTTHLIASILSAHGKKVFTNRSGSNMTRGLLASIVRHASVGGRLKYDIAVLEIDEAYAAKLGPILKPRAAVLTNVLRDQLDRFGEIDTTAALLKQLAAHVSEVVVYNGMDSRLHDVGEMTAVRTVSYGVAGKLEMHVPDDDALYAAQGVRHWRKKKLDYVLTSADDKTCMVEKGSARLSIDRSALPGWHNVFNLTAAVALCTELYPEIRPRDFANLGAPYGRGETVDINGARLTLQLVKNPAGFRTAMEVEPSAPALVIINDLIADGRDVSWLWDVDVAGLVRRPRVSVSGSRAHDMAVRLKYEETKTAWIEPDLKQALRRFVREGGGVVFLTYTAMMQARKSLGLKGGGHE